MRYAVSISYEDTSPSEPADIYARTGVRLRPQHWWPATDAVRGCSRAVLTQPRRGRTSRRQSLPQAAHAMTAIGLLVSPGSDSNRPSARRILQVKARYLRALATWIDQRAGGDLSTLASEDPGALRSEILGLRGVGKETADSILLYAIGKPVFVVDAYTRRITARLRMLPENATYDATQRYFTTRLPEDTQLFNEFHALLVHLAKEHCRTKSVCPACPLEQSCPSAGTSSTTDHAVNARTRSERRLIP